MKPAKTGKKRGFELLFFIIILLSGSCVFYNPSPVSDDIDLFQYQPFSEKNKLAVLEEEPGFRLFYDLPVLDGATALYPLYAAFAQAVYPEGIYSTNGRDSIVGWNRTDRAFERLIAGEADLIFCAHPSEDQIKRAEENGRDLIMTPIGIEAFVFFVNNRNLVNNLDTTQIRGIYSGRITNWKDLGGKKKDIKVYQREKNSGSQTMLISIMGEETIIEPETENVLGFMGEMVTRVTEYRNKNNAIGYSFLFFTTQMVQNKKIRLLSINGIMPSKETIQNGTYPYTDYFYAITIDTNKKNVNDFIEWMISPQGQFLVEKTGYIPVK